MKTPVFTGSSVAIVTPFDGGEIDYTRLARRIEDQLAAGTAAITVCGTTGESAALSEQEHAALVRFTVEQVRGRAAVIAGTGSNNMETALRRSRTAEKAGADALLCVTPYYNKTSQEGLVRYYYTIADSVTVPVIAYNVPSRTGLSITPETCGVLARHENINGIKEASGNIAAVASILARSDGDFFVWSGNDSETVPQMALGAKGVISVAANLIPGVMREICALCLSGRFPEAARLQLQYDGLIRALFCDVNPIPVKTAMALLHTDSGALRLPLVPPGEKETARIVRELSRAGLLHHE